MHIHQIRQGIDELISQITELIDENINKYDKIVIKIEDKDIGKLLKMNLNNSKIALYNGDTKECEIDSNGMIIRNKGHKIDIATSTIQAGQSLKENVL